MKRELKPNDTVYTPSTNFNSGETWLEERKVKEVGGDYIVLTHVATIRRHGDTLSRMECREPTEHRGDKDELDYYSRPFDVIMKEYKDQNDWFCSRILEDEEKYK